MRASVLLLIMAALLGAQDPTPEEVRFTQRLAALPGNAERMRLIEAEKTPITENLVRAFLREGNRLMGRDRPGEASDWYELALGCAERYGFENLKPSALGNIGAAYARRSELEKALDYYQRAVDLAKKLGRMDAVSNNLNSISIAKRQSGNYDEALAAAREALSVAETLGDKSLEGSARTSLSNAWNALGDYRLALEQLLRVLQIAQDIGSKEGQAYTLNNVGSLYYDLGNPELALEYFQRSLRIKEQLGSSSSLASTLLNVAETLVHMGDHRRAAEYGERALRLAETADNKPVLGRALETLSQVDHAEGRTPEAIDRLKRAVQIMDSAGNYDYLPAFLAELGQYQEESGQFEMGLATLNRAIAESRKVGERRSLYNACSSAGEAYRKLGRLAEARHALLDAIEAVESLTRDLGGGAEAQQRFLANKLDPYREMVLLAVEEGRIDEAFGFAERGRTQALLEVLRQGRISVTKAMTEEEKQKERRLRMGLAALNERLSQARSANAADRAGTRQTEVQLQRLRLEQTDFETALYATHPELKHQRLDVPPPAPADVAASLPDRKTALLEYIVAPDRTLLFAIGKGSSRVQVARIPISSKALEAKIDSLARIVASGSPDYRGAARELDKLLIEPARSALAGRTSAVIIPDGPLWRLPFPALEAESGQSLLDRYTLSYVPSATVLRELMTRRHAGPIRTILALGNPPGANLADAETEVDALRELYGSANARVLTGGAATESAFKAQAGRYDVLHVASHGVIEDRNPLYSYVTLAKSESEDGFLEAREMLNLNLNAQLVVLSACETASGKSGGGEGLIGMTWALFLAGSPATVASGWQVDSAATARLMLDMHRGLRQGLGRAAALRAAELALKKDPRYSHPFYWAAFSLSGNGF